MKSDLTNLRQRRPDAMHDLAHQPPPSTLELIDQALAAAKRAAHSCRDAKAREHFEFALALLSESWIDSAAPPRPSGSLRLSVSLRSAAESGQQARSPERVTADVRSALDLFSAVTARASSFIPQPSSL